MMDITPINLYRLQVFMAVARKLSFTRASERLHTSQPNISKQVRQLEGELGISLFDRGSGQVALTDAGRIVLDYSERLFETVGDMRRALNELQGLERGYLRLGASSTPGNYLLPAPLVSFRRQYPNLELTFHLGNSQMIVQGVLRGEFDLGFVEGFETTTGIQVQTFARDALVLIASVDHILVGMSHFTPADLERETFIWREAGSGTRQGMSRLLEDAQIHPANSLELYGCEGVKRAVAAGLGLSVVSRQAIEMELSFGALALLSGERLSLERSLYIVTRKDQRPSVTVLAFLAHLRGGFSTDKYNAHR